MELLLCLLQQDPKAKTHVETRLDILVQDLMDRYSHNGTHTQTQGHTTDELNWCVCRIGEEFGLKSIKLILNGKTLISGEFFYKLICFCCFDLVLISCVSVRVCV